jgi:hypothetical protein
MFPKELVKGGGLLKSRDTQGPICSFQQTTNMLDERRCIDESPNLGLGIGLEEVLADSPMARNRLREVQKGVEDWGDDLLRLTSAATKLGSAAKGAFSIIHLHLHPSLSISIFLSAELSCSTQALDLFVFSADVLISLDLQCTRTRRRSSRRRYSSWTPLAIQRLVRI